MERESASNHTLSATNSAQAENRSTSSPPVIVVENGTVNRSDSGPSTRKKRKRTAFSIDPFIETLGDSGFIKYLCCNKRVKRNDTRARDHFRQCQSFRLKYNADYHRLTRETSEITTENSNRSTLSNYFCRMTPEHKKNLDEAFAYAIIYLRC